MMPEEPSLKWPYVSLAWTAANYRRSGIARLLLQEIARVFNVTPQELAYDSPFSPEGLRLVQQFAGLRFIASTAHLMTIIGVPIEHEHWLTECHCRTVVGPNELEAALRLRQQAGLDAIPRVCSGCPLKARADTSGGLAELRTSGRKPPEEKDDDVAAFARTRVNPGVDTNPHSGEYGYTEPAGSPWFSSSRALNPLAVRRPGALGALVNKTTGGVRCRYRSRFLPGQAS